MIDAIRSKTLHTRLSLQSKNTRAEQEYPSLIVCYYLSTRSVSEVVVSTC